MSGPLAAPFPYFGGKRRAAPIVWAAGYSTRRDNGRRERLWLSPSCLIDHGNLLDLLDGAS